MNSMSSDLHNKEIGAQLGSAEIITHKNEDLF